MKYSIRRQLALICAAMIAGTIILCYVLNSFFSEDYYTKKKKSALTDAYAAINAASNEGSIASNEFDLELRRICNTYNLDMIVMDERTSTVKSSDNNPQMLVDQLLQNLFLSGNDETAAGAGVLEKKERYTIQLIRDGEDDEFIEMWGLLDTGNLFLIRSSLAGIRDSVSIANSFLAYVGMVSILVSVVIALFVSGRITKPISELAEISSRMKKLDFSAKYSGSSQNEFAVLGQNINELSEELEKNISELKTANNELKNDLEKKNRIDEMRKEFLANVSHELKTPIALIQGYAEGLREGISDDPENRAFYCDVITDEAAKMNRMVKELLTLNQLEFGNEMVSVERFDIAELITNYLKSVSLLMKQNEITVTEPEQKSLYVWGDEFRIQEVIANYISNAVHYASPAPDGQKRICVTIEEQEGVVRVSVYNTGQPVPEESLPYIWDKFYKVDKARTREYGGSGIGLSIVKAVMDSLHQSYGADNQDDGVIFWFELEKA